jgi:hypothetical protein
LYVVEEQAARHLIRLNDSEIATQGARFAESKRKATPTLSGGTAQ